jgi:hypothetical protein
MRWVEQGDARLTFSDGHSRRRLSGPWFLDALFGSMSVEAGWSTLKHKRRSYGVLKDEGSTVTTKGIPGRWC